MSRRRQRLRAAGLVAGGAAVAFGVMVWGVFSGGSIVAIDHELAAWIQDRATPAWLSVMTVVSNLHRPRGIWAGTAVVAGVLLWRREPAHLWLLLASVGAGSGLNHLLKHSFRRPRPGDEASLVAATDFGFPSGHVTSATLLYGAVAVLVVCGSRSAVVRAGAVASAVFMVLWVAASRLVLGAHYLSDVAAGAAVGAGWLALCVIPLLLWRERAARA